jgi:hypothetical protein
MKYYTGIGSRETPIDIQKLMTHIAIALSNDNWILRSGGAEGADTAFELGAKYKRIYLPWNGFNNRSVDTYSYVVPPYNDEMVYDYHPSPERLSAAAMKFMSRNSYQVLGDSLDSPSQFVACWTVNGKESGGTAQAMRIAKDYHIPIYNLFHESEVTRLCTDFKIRLA